MGVSGNIGDGSSNSVVTKKGFKMIYGIAPFNVVAINPTMEQLVELGINAQKEPEYVGDKTRIEFWMRTVLNEKPTEGSPDKSLEELGITQQIIQKQTFFISNTKKGKSDGSTHVWINNFGNICSTGVGDTPSLSKWKSNGQHIAREGEIELIKFIRAWVNASTGDEVFIDDWDALIRGNVTELREILRTFKNNIVRSMIEVRIAKDGKAYAGISDRHHEPWSFTGIKGFMDEFKTPRKGYYVSYQLQEFIPPTIVPTQDEVPAEGNKWV